MRIFKITLVSIVNIFLFTSCVLNEFTDDQGFVSGYFVEEYDLWYVDYHATQGADEIPFMQLAFTMSFVDGKIFANNNISGIGYQGNGYGIQVGDYSISNSRLIAAHDLDGVNYFEVIQNPNVENEIELYNSATNTSYFLIGYSINDFDYDKLFYENIEYLLQDYELWSKYETSIDGFRNEFDDENYLSFTPENNKTFYSSRSLTGTNFDSLFWDYEGSYEVYDVDGYFDLKVLTLHYDSVNTEKFELSIENDNIVELFHISSGTTYRFRGDYFIQYLKNGKSKKEDRIERKRTKIKRQKIKKISY